jgi:hypothetical protein
VFLVAAVFWQRCQKQKQHGDDDERKKAYHDRQQNCLIAIGVRILNQRKEVLLQLLPNPHQPLAAFIFWSFSGVTPGCTCLIWQLVQVSSG